TTASRSSTSCGSTSAVRTTRWPTIGTCSSSSGWRSRPPAEGRMIHPEYLVRYGRAGAFGRFRAAGPLSLSRGDSVVVRLGRGPELGEVLRAATARHAVHLPELAGELLRPASAEDMEAGRVMAERAQEVIGRAEEIVISGRMPLAPLDAEVLLDG